MKRWLRRIRGAIGLGMTWAAAWFGVGLIVQLGFLLVTGSRADAPIPLVFGVLGFLAGATFSAVLGVVERPGRFDQLSIPRFAAWGAAGGFFVSAIFVLAVALAGESAFLSSLVLLGPIFGIAGAASAAGSLALARRAEHRALVESRDELADVGLSDAEARELLGGGG